MDTIKQCPICKNDAFNDFLECKDYTVSGENFMIASCMSCNFKFTNPRPLENKIGDYYKSDNYISHSDTDQGIINKLYKSVRKITLKQKYHLINLKKSKGKILDVGCGTGHFLHECIRNGWTGIGIEPDTDARDLAIKKAAVDIKDESYLNELPKESFDVITLWHVLEHVYNLNKRVEELKRLLKADGRLIVAVPNCDSYDAEYYNKHWAAYDLPRHLYHFTPKDMEKLMSAHQLKIVEVKPMKFDAFYVSLLSEKYKTGNTKYFNALKVALKSNLIAAKNKEPKYSSQIYIIEKLEAN